MALVEANVLMQLAMPMNRESAPPPVVKRKPVLAPWPYFGGKSRASDIIWARLGEPRVYVEPFCGSAAVLLSRPLPSGLEIIGDSNGFVVNALRAIRTCPDAVLDHYDTPPSDFDCVARGRWLCETWAVDSADRLRSDPDWCDAKAAAWWIYVTCSTFTCGRDQTRYYDWSTDAVTVSARTQAGIRRTRRQGFNSLAACGTAAETLRAVSARLRHVVIYCGDWHKTVRGADAKEGPVALVLDPPYAMTQRSYTMYPQEWSDTTNTALIDLCREYGDNPNARIALCGFEGEYDLPGWEAMAWKRGGAGALNGTTQALERIWFSPHCLPAGVAS